MLCLEGGGYLYLTIQKERNPLFFNVPTANLIKALNREEINNFLSCAYWICYHPILGWYQRPDSQGDVGFGNITSDAVGSRISSIQDTTLSIATYGDSFTQGIEVDDKDTFQAQLSTRTGVRVENYGILGFGTDQALLYLEKNLQRGDRPRIVILGILSENMNRLMNAFRPYYTYPSIDITFGMKPILVSRNQSWEFVHNVVPSTLSDEQLAQLIDAASPYDAFAKLRTEHVVFPYSLSTFHFLSNAGPSAYYKWPGQTEEAQEKLQFILERFSKNAETYSFIPVVLFLPMNTDQLFLSETPQLHKSLPVSHDTLTVIDISKEVRSHKWTKETLPSDYTPYLVKTHPSAKGYSLITDIIHAKLCTESRIKAQEDLHKKLCATFIASAPTDNATTEPLTDLLP